MTRLPRHRACAGIISCLSAIVISGCATPLAPGYKIQKETLSVHFIPGNPPHLAIRADYILANIGNSPLHFIGVELPSEKDFGLANFGAKIDSKDVAPQHNPHEAAEDWRIPLAASWQQKQKISLTISYDLAASTASDPRIFVTTNMFYLNDSGWFPALMGFKVFLSPSVTRPNPTDLSVVVPAGFRVTASGQLRATKKQSAETEYRFLIRNGDFNPYVLAGQYSEQRVSTDGVTVAIWTFNPIPADQAQKTSAQIAAAANFYAKNFGPLPRSMKTIYDVKPAEREKEDLTSQLERSHWLPGVVYGPTLDFLGAGKALDGGDTLGIDFDDYISKFGDSVELPATWFEHMIVARPEAWLLPGALSVHASEALHGTGESRSERIADFLSEYDRDRAEAVERPTIALTDSDPQDRLQIGYVKMQLFLFALEDKCGQQNLTHAIHDMVYALRGEEYGYNDFRASVEQQCHQDLGGFFRTWLNQPGIPPDFRARYGNSSGPK